MKRKMRNEWSELGIDCRGGKNIAGWKRRARRENLNAQDGHAHCVMCDPQFEVRGSGFEIPETTSREPCTFALLTEYSGGAHE